MTIGSMIRHQLVSIPYASQSKFWYVLNKIAAYFHIGAGRDSKGANLCVGDKLICRCCNAVGFAELRHRDDWMDGFAFEGSQWERIP